MADHNEIILSHSEEFHRINQRLRDEETFTKKMIEVTADNKAAIDHLIERLDKSDRQTEVLIEMSASFKYMVDELKKTSDNVKELMGIQSDHNIRILDIEKEKYDARFKVLEENHNKQFETFEVKLNEIDNRVAKKVLKYLDGMLIVALGAVALFILYKITGGQIGG